jgi:hypothetical protein
MLVVVPAGELEIDMGCNCIAEMEQKKSQFTLDPLGLALCCWHWGKRKRLWQRNA